MRQLNKVSLATAGLLIVSDRWTQRKNDTPPVPQQDFLEPRASLPTSASMLLLTCLLRCVISSELKNKESLGHNICVI